MPLKRGVTVWILGFLTFLSAVNVVYAILLWRIDGPSSIIDPYLVGKWIGTMQVSTYFWASVTATFIFFGLASISAFLRMPPDPTVVRMLMQLGGHLGAMKKTAEATQKDLQDGLETNRVDRVALFKKTSENLENARQEMLEVLMRQDRTIQKVREDTVTAVKTNLSSVRKELLGKLDSHTAAVQGVRRVSQRNASVIEKQMESLAEMQAKLDRMEAELALPKPILSSRNDLEEIKGIGSELGKELRSLGLTNVGELIAADPATIAEKTRPSPEVVERLQQKALLLMIPGMDETDVRLLKEVGVTSRKDLSEHDPVLLSRRIEEVAKTYVDTGKLSKEEKPTFEEILSWVKNARF